LLGARDLAARQVIHNLHTELSPNRPSARSNWGLSAGATRHLQEISTF
jgi:hypothetical protein